MSSKTIDTKVVEMRFDNSKFENGVKQSVNTLDKLKTALGNLKNHVLNINTDKAQSGVSALRDNVESVGTKFSAMEVIAFGALTRIGAKAEEAGERLLKALTIDQVSAGYKKYEQKTTAVQTLVNSTGKSVEEINEYLEKLMWYSDETSYGFTDMTSALATMTSSGGDIEKLIPMIEGVANATAFAGKGAAEFSRLMQFGINQAYALGYMQVKDWSSIESATVNSKQLQESLIGAAEALGKIEKGSVTISNFRDSLQDKWLDKEVMEAGFGRFAELTEAAYEAVQSGKFDTASEAIEALGDSYDEIATRAFKSAQEAKTFTEAIEATKDAVSSGWMKSFEIIFGDYNRAKEIWTDLANSMWDFFAGGAEGRNKMLSEVLGDSWDTLTSKIEACGVPMEQFEKQLERVAESKGINMTTIKNRFGGVREWIQNENGIGKTLIAETLQAMADGQYKMNATTEDSIKTLDKYQEAINRVMKGEMGNGAERVKKLTDAQYDAAGVQKLINHLYKEGGNTYKNMTVTAEDLTKVLGDLTVEEQKELGLNQEQIDMLQELAKEAAETGTPIQELIDRMNKPSGGTLLIQSIADVLVSLASAANIIKNAFKEIFAPESSESVYIMIESIQQVTGAVRAFFEEESNVDKLTRAFKGLFAIVDIIATLFGRAFRIAVELAKAVMEVFGGSILDTTAIMGDNIVTVRDWIKAHDFVPKVIEKIITPLKQYLILVKTWISDNELLAKAGEKISDAFRSFTNYLYEFRKGLSETDDIPKYLKDTFINSLTIMFEYVKEIFTNIKNFIIDVFNGNVKDNPAYAEAGASIISSFLNGLQSGSPVLYQTVMNIGNVVIKAIKDLPWDSISAILLASGLVLFVAKIQKTFKNIYDLMVPFSNLMTELQKDMSRVSKGLKSIAKAEAFEIIAQGVLYFAAAIGTLALSIFMLANIKDGKALAGATIVLALICGALVAATISIGNFLKQMDDETKKFSSKEQILKTIQIFGIMILLAGSIAALAFECGAIALILGSMPLGSFIQGMAAIVIILGGLVFLVKEAIRLSKEIKTYQQAYSMKVIAEFLSDIAKILFAFSLALAILNFSSLGAIGAAAAIFVGIGFFIKWMIKLSKDAKGINDMEVISNFIKSLSWTFISIAVMIKILKGIDLGALLGGIEVFGGIAVLMGLSVKLAKEMYTDQQRNSLDQIGKSVKDLSKAMLMMSIALKIIGGMDVGDFTQAIAYMIAFGIFIRACAKTSNLIQKEIDGFGRSMRDLATALLIMSFAIGVLSIMSWSSIGKGLTAILALAAISVAISHFAGDKKSDVSLISLMTSIGILAIVAAICGIIPVDNLKRGIMAVAALSVMAVFISNNLQTQSEEANKAMTGMAVVIGTMAVAMALLSLCDPAYLTVAFLCVAGLVAIASLLAKNAGNLNDKNIFKSLLAMAGVIAVMGLIVGVLAAFVSPEAAIASAVGIGVLLLALAASMKILSSSDMGYLGDIGFKKLMKPLLAVALTVAILGVVIGLIGMLPMNPVSAIVSAVAIALLLEAMAGALSIMTKFPPLDIGGSEFKSLAYMCGIVAILALILGLCSAFNVEGSISTATALVELLAGLVGVTYAAEKLGNVKGSVTKGIIALGEVAGFVVVLIAIAALIGYIVDQTEFFNYAAKAFKGIGKALGSLFGGIAEGISEGVSNGLKSVGEGLSDFWNNSKEFFNGIKELGPDTLKSVGILADALLTLTATSLVDQLSNFISKFTTGESPFAKMGSDMEALGTGIKSFANAMVGVDETALANIEPASKAALNLCGLMNALPKTDGVWQEWFGKETDLGTFGSQIELFGQGMANFAGSIKDLTAEDVKKMEDISGIGAALANICNGLSVMTITDIISKWFLETDSPMSTFGKNIVNFGTKMSSFAKSISGLSQEDIDRMDNVATMAGKFKDIANALPRDNNGALSLLIGEDTDLSEFGQQINDLGDMMTQSVTHFNKIKNSDIDHMSKCVTDLMTSLKNLPTDDQVSIGELGSQLPTLADRLVEFASNLYDNYNAAYVEYAMPSLSSLFDFLVNTVPQDYSSTSLNSFKEAIGILGTMDFASAITAISAASGVDNEIFQKALSAAYSIIDAIAVGIKERSDGPKSIAHALSWNLTFALQAMRDKFTYFHDIGFDLVGEIISGIKMGRDSLDYEGRITIDELRQKMMNAIDNFKAIGMNIQYKIRDGLTDSSARQSIINAATGIGNDINRAIQQAVNLQGAMSYSYDQYNAPMYDEISLDYAAPDEDEIFELYDAAIQDYDWDSIDIQLNAKLNVDTEYLDNQLKSIDNAMTMSATPTSTGNIVDNGGTTITFTQNNYSPTALNRTDIYRATNNQISQLKGAMA